MRFALLLATLLSGCTEVRAVRGPDGEQMFQVTCYDEGPAPCMNRAAKICKSGYKIVSQSADEQGYIMTGAGGSIVGGTSTANHMLVTCSTGH